MYSVNRINEAEARHQINHSAGPYTKAFGFLSHGSAVAIRMLRSGKAEALDWKSAGPRHLSREGGYSKV
jgi:hypothetical protein